jgi:hypothetical protein
MSEPVSSVHPVALLPLHRHANVIRQALSHLWPTLHTLTCLCVAPALAPHALVHCVAPLGRHAYFPIPMCRLAPMRDTLHPQLDPRDAPPASYAAQHRRPHAPVRCAQAEPTPSRCVRPATTARAPTVAHTPIAAVRVPPAWLSHTQTQRPSPLSAVTQSTSITSLWCCSPSTPPVNVPPPSAR